mmetsp:Transcript_15137/g.32647  ORF Transcript_15137/g.32647 Transcript_15137/m.32647 type:complete len:92 (+) Transcript_15137:631-906(+)
MQARTKPMSTEHPHFVGAFMLDITPGKQGCPAKQKTKIPTDRGMFEGCINAACPNFSYGSDQCCSNVVAPTMAAAARNIAEVEIKERYAET